MYNSSDIGVNTQIINNAIKDKIRLEIITHKYINEILYCYIIWLFQKLYPNSSNIPHKTFECLNSFSNAQTLKRFESNLGLGHLI